LAQLSEELM